MANGEMDHAVEEERRHHHRRHHHKRHERARQNTAVAAAVEPVSASPEDSGNGQGDSPEPRTGESEVYLSELGELEKQLELHEAYFQNVKENSWRGADAAKQEEAKLGLLRDRDKMSNLAYKISLYREKAEGCSQKDEILSKTEDLLNRYHLANEQFDSCMEAVNSSITDAQTEELIEQLEQNHKARWDRMKSDKPTYAQYKQLNSKLNYIDYQAKRLEPSTSEQGIKRQQYLNDELDRERKRLELVLAKLSPEEQQQAQKKQEKSKVLEQALNNRYNAASPIVRLIWKAKAVKDKKRPEEPKKGRLEKIIDAYSDAKEKWDEAFEDVSEVADPIVEEKTEEESLGDWLKAHAAAVVKWLAGKLNAKEAFEAVSGAKEFVDELIEMFEPLVNAGKFLKGIKEFIDQSQDMSGEEIRRNLEGILGDAVNLVVEQIMNLVKLIKPVPFLGGISGLIGNAVSVVQQVLQLLDRKSHKDEAAQNKEMSKFKMVQKREKYSQDEDLKELGLYDFAQVCQEKKGFFRKRTVEAVHLNKKGKKGQDAGAVTLDSQSAELEAEFADVNLYEEMDKLKLKKNSEQVSKEEKQRYYKMKTLAQIRQHKEMKEDKYVNEKRIRQNWIDIAHEGVDVVANIASFVPGIGQAISSGASFANSVGKVGHKYGTKMRQAIRDRRGSEKSTANKEVKRSAMAENIYAQMLFVSGYMKDEENTERTVPLFQIGEDSASRVYKQMEYMEMLTRTLSYQFSNLLGTENRDDLLDLMSSAFSREG